MVLRYFGKALVVGLALSNLYGSNLGASGNPMFDNYSMDRCLASCGVKRQESRADINARMVCDGRGDEVDGPSVDREVKDIYDGCVDACSGIVDDVNACSDDGWDCEGLFF
ncbi:hypothetical protein ACFL0V_05275 [Nanoarchaeota archaeon]